MEWRSMVSRWVGVYGFICLVQGEYVGDDFRDRPARDVYTFTKISPQIRLLYYCPINA
jgi:hypothetical protein